LEWSPDRDRVENIGIWFTITMIFATDLSVFFVSYLDLLFEEFRKYTT